MVYRSIGRNVIIRKAITLLFAVCLLAGCGKKDQGNHGGLLSSGQPGSEADEPQGRYKAELLETESDTAAWSSVKQAGNYVYFSLYSDDAETGSITCSMYRYALSDGGTEPVSVVIRNGSLPYYDIGENGDIYAYVVYRESPGTEGEGTVEVRLEKYDAKGNRIYSTKIEEPPTDTRLFQMAADGNDRVYLCYNGQIFFFDGQGNLTGSMTSLGGPENTLTAMGRGKDGAVYACITRGAATPLLIKLDFAKRATDIVTEDFVACVSGGLCAGWEGNTLLAQNGGMVYEYDLTNKSRKALLRWTDSGLRGDQVLSVGAAPEGKILAAKTGNTEKEAGIFLLSRLSDEEAPQKEEIVLATDVLIQDGRYPDPLLSEAVLAFNNSNDKYYVTIREYGKYLDEASTKLNLDMASGKGPDIIYGDLLYQAARLAKQGALEDLDPWLEQSTVIGREDFVDHALDVGIYDGKLVILPQSFYLSTVIGRASDVGEDMGWTMEELIAMQEKHPEAQLFNDVIVHKNNTLGRCLTFYMDQFVDWDTGKCSFDSPEFIRLLEFVDRYGDADGDSDSMYAGMSLNKGKALLTEKLLTSLEERQYYDGVFEGEACAVGYPTKDGEPASFIQHGVRCSITAASEHKEGAWAFLESFVTYPTKDLFLSTVNVPAVKVRFEEYLEGKLAQEEEEILAYDLEKHELILDEKGNPVILGKGININYFGGTNDSGYVIIHALTQEDVDWFMDILRVARVNPPEQKEIKTILFEEAEYFFNGAKSAQEVAAIIQNRVQLYLNESFS